MPWIRMAYSVLSNVGFRTENPVPGLHYGLIPADAASATMNPSGDLSIARRIVTGRPRHRCAVWLGKGASARVEPGRLDRAVGRLYL